MDWEKLMSAERLRTSTTADPKDRSQYLRDYDRIIFSKPFRRLQKKTQVFPLPEHDFIHTRLTHSLETSCIGRSLGMAAGTTILESDFLPNDTTLTAYDFAAVVSAASLAHDLGNPPFGHSGEDAIADFFKSQAGSHFLEGLAENEKLDFTRFEGNAMGYRVMTNTLPGVSGFCGGINLTYATLGAFSKYPKEVTALKLDECCGKKYGFFQTEKLTFSKIAEKLGMIKREDSSEAVAYYRHPLAFLVEAADDISYLLMDLEDGMNLKLVSAEKVEALFTDLIIKDKSKLAPGNILDPRERVGYLRALAISSLIDQVSIAFKEKLPAIMEGTYNVPLAEIIPSSAKLKEIRTLCVDDVYSYRKVLEIEAAGFEVIGGLLGAFLYAIIDDSKKAKKVISLLPKHYNAPQVDPNASKYETIMHVVQFVAGMTDTFAIDTYRSIKGIRLPNY